MRAKTSKRILVVVTWVQLILVAAFILLRLGQAQADEGPDRAGRFLERNGGVLNDLVVAAVLCAAVDDAGQPAAISRDQNALAIQCSTRGEADAKLIRAELQRLKLESVAVARTGADDVVAFRFPTSGVLRPRCKTDLVYHARAQEGSKQIEHDPDGDILADTRALTPPPYHWFWRCQT